jgi:hypothetical protein
VADPPAVEDQPVAQQRPLALVEERADLGLHLDRVVLRGPPEPPREPPEVRVDRDAGHPERVAEHDVGRLAPDARQRHEVLEPPGHLAVEALDERSTDLHQRVGLLPEEAGRLHDRLELGPLLRRHSRPPSGSG